MVRSYSDCGSVVAADLFNRRGGQTLRSELAFTRVEPRHAVVGLGAYLDASAGAVRDAPDDVDVSVAGERPLQSFCQIFGHEDVGGVLGGERGAVVVGEQHANPGAVL
jgi:hypothetical protein